MEKNEVASPEKPVTTNGTPNRIDPDLSFIRAVGAQAGPTFKKCFQCGTCSSTCELSPEEAPFPRKEMSWATWGLKDRLLTDVDVWLCHQCNDCSAMCPRGGRPGDVMAAVRKEVVAAYSPPGFLARSVADPRFFPLLLGVAAALLSVPLLLRGPIENLLGISRYAPGNISFSYSSTFPHWMINSFFFLVLVAVAAVVVRGVKRYWKDLAAKTAPEKLSPPAMEIWPAIRSTIADVFLHRKFQLCTTARPRTVSHILVLFGFLGLTVVTLWVITSRINPLITGDFVYPFSFLSPFKILANLGGAAVLGGTFLMGLDRVRRQDEVGASTWFDWSLIGLIFLVAATGFLTELLHYTRFEPHRHAAYFIHLVCVLSLFLYLPYSKLAHLVYRTTAMVFAKHIGRKIGEANG